MFLKRPESQNTPLVPVSHPAYMRREERVRSFRKPHGEANRDSHEKTTEN